MIRRAFTFLSTHYTALLALAGITYATGYVVWLLVAWFNDYGPMPVLDAQYFVAGVPPLAVLLATYYLILSMRAIFLKRWPAWLAARRRTVRISIELVIAAVSLASVLVWQLLGNPYSWVAVLLLACSLVAFLLSSPPKRGTAFLVHALPMLAALFLFYSFVATAYMKIPRALGGARPQCAEVDLRRDELSRETLDLLAGSDSTRGQEPVVRSKRLVVLVATSEALLVRPSSMVGDVPERIEIPRSAVTAIRWDKTGLWANGSRVSVIQSS